MGKIILIAILIILFIYLVIWTLQLYFFNKRQQKVKRMQQLREKNKSAKRLTIDNTKNYWYNLREIEESGEEENIDKYFHYFNDVNEGVHSLLVEMYDCGIVRTDELGELAYGKNRFQNIDLSFLEELERELSEDDQPDVSDNLESNTDENVDFIDFDCDDEVVQIDGGLGEFFKPKNIVDAAKNLKEDDPGIMDIHGTLSEGVEDVIAAVEEEKRIKAEKEEPILPKKEKSVEEARKVRENTANAETRQKIYDKWAGYVSTLYETINMNADEELQKKIRKALMDYGYNDVDVLLESPE